MRRSGTITNIENESTGITWEPTFFIIGAPKCGTTALSFYLSQHPNVCFSLPKEPHFFSKDMPEYTMCDKKAYQDFFNCEDNENVKSIGEGSTWYMYSTVAVNNILNFNKDAKIIAMIRNPMHMAESLYYQFLYEYEEDAPSFEIAWKLQSSRAEGKNIPENMIEPIRLQYKKVCALGTQLERLMSIVPEKQLKIILFDDFILDAKSVYEDVLRFLELPTDERVEFQKINESKTHHFKFVSELTQQPSKILDPFVKWIKGKFNIKRIGITRFLKKVNQRKNVKKPLSVPFKKELYANFASEIRLIEKLLNRDLKDWHI